MRVSDSALEGIIYTFRRERKLVMTRPQFYDIVRRWPAFYLGIVCEVSNVPRWWPEWLRYPWFKVTRRTILPPAKELEAMTLDLIARQSLLIDGMYRPVTISEG